MQRLLGVRSLWSAPKHPRAHYSVLFMGTDDVAVPTLQHLIDCASSGSQEGRPHISRITVVTPPDATVRRKRKQLTLVPPVAELARQHGLPHLAAPEIKTGVPGAGIRDALANWNELEAHGPHDVAVVVSFGYFLTKNVLEACKLGAINMHPSLLPAWRGAAPIPRCILAGDAETGVSVIGVDAAKWDAGDILWQQRMRVGQEETEAQLRERCAAVGAHAVSSALLAMQQGTVQPLAQAAALQASSDRQHAYKLPKSLSQWPLDATALSAAALHNRVRACGLRMGVHARVMGTKHTIIIRALQRHADYTPQECDMELLSVPLCDLPQAAAPAYCRVQLPKGLANATPGAQPAGTIVYDKGSKSLWLSTSDDWLHVVAADLKSKPSMPVHVLANNLGLASQGQPMLQDGVLVGPVAQLGCVDRYIHL